MRDAIEVFIHHSYQFIPSIFLHVNEDLLVQVHYIHNCPVATYIQ